MTHNVQNAQLSFYSIATLLAVFFLVIWDYLIIYQPHSCILACEKWVNLGIRQNSGRIWPLCSPLAAPFISHISSVRLEILSRIDSCLIRSCIMSFCENASLGSSRLPEFLRRGLEPAGVFPVRLRLFVRRGHGMLTGRR